MGLNYENEKLYKSPSFPQIPEFPPHPNLNWKDYNMADVISVEHVLVELMALNLKFCLPPSLRDQLSTDLNHEKEKHHNSPRFHLIRI